MKQIMLRVPDDVHERITARAKREHRSVNSLATQILDAAADADRPPSPTTGMSRQDRLRARARELGLLIESEATPASAEDRARTIAGTKGLGPVADRLLDEQRGGPR